MSSAAPIALQVPSTWGPAIRFLAATTVSFFGDWLSTVALVVVLYRLTGSAAAPAGYVLARVGPRVLGPMPGGLLADRYSPARVVAACSVVQGLLTASLVVWTHLHFLWAIYGAVAAAQLLGAAARPSHGSLIPQLVPEDRLTRLNALYGTAIDTSLFIAPAVGSVLLIYGGPDLLLILDALTFGFAAALILTLPAQQAASGATGPPLQAAFAGLRIVQADPLMRTFVVSLLTGGIVVTATQAVLVVAAGERFGGADNVGILYAAVGIGGLLGGAYTIRYQPKHINQWLVVAATLLEIVPLLLLAITSIFAVALVLLLLCGAGGAIYPNWGNTELQRRAPADVLGRVNAVSYFALFGGMLVGAVAALVLVPALGWVDGLVIIALSGLSLLAIVTLSGRHGQAHPLRSDPS